MASSIQRKPSLLFNLKSPKPRLICLRGVADANAGVDGVFGACAVVLQPKPVFGGEVEGIVCSCDAQKLCGASGSFCALNAPYQHPFGVVGGACYNIEKLVHSVAEIDVGDAASLIEGFSAGRAPLVGVAGGILLAEITLGLGYARFYYISFLIPAAEKLAEKVGSKGCGRL